MNKNTLKQLFDRIAVKLHNDKIGNIDVAYIDYDDTPNTTMVMKPIFVAFHDRDFNEYFKLAFTADMLENRPSINNPLGDPMLTAMGVYQTVKSYYLQWRKQQMMSGSWASQSTKPCVQAREKAVAYDPASAYATQAYAAQDSIFTAKLAGIGATVFDKSKAAIKVDLGTADAHTSAPWDDPLIGEQRARDIAKQHNYTMSNRVDMLYRAIGLLKNKKHFDFEYTNITTGKDYGSINCKISIVLDKLPPNIVRRKDLDFDIPERMFDKHRHNFDNSVRIPADEEYLTETHLILRLAYIIYQATKLKDIERITNEIIHTNNISTSERYIY